MVCRATRRGRYCSCVTSSRCAASCTTMRSARSGWQRSSHGRCVCRQHHIMLYTLLASEGLMLIVAMQGAPSAVSKQQSPSSRVLEVKVRPSGQAHAKASDAASWVRFYSMLSRVPVQVVKSGQETRQVVSPVHLPNATGGAQSVYAVQKQTSSPAPSGAHVQEACATDVLPKVTMLQIQ